MVAISVRCKLAMAYVKNLQHMLAGCSRVELVMLNVSYLSLIASCGW